MEKNLEKLDLLTKLNKKFLKDKYLKEHIFQELTINNNDKEDDIQTKISNIKSKELNDLKLIDIRLIQRNLLFQQNLETNRINSKKQVNSFSNTVKKKKQKETKIFPYISFSKKNKNKYKSTDNKKNYNIKNNKNSNNEEKKLFMTKIENMKRFNNFIINNNNKYTNIKENKLNQTYHKNKSLKKSIKLNENHKTEYNLESNENNEILDTQKKIKNNNQQKSSGEINSVDDKNNFFKDTDKDDIVIYKLLQKNKELEKFFNYKQGKITKKGHSIRNSIISKIKNKNSSLNKQQLNKKEKKIENKKSIDYKNIINLTQQKESIENSKKRINLNLFKMSNLKNCETTGRNTILNTMNIKNNHSSNDNLNEIDDNDLDFNKIINNRPLLIEIINLIKEMKIKVDLLKDLKNKEKLKRLLYIIKVNNLEQDINEDFKKTNNKLKISDSFINKMKIKCKNILKDLDKRINFNLEEFIKEYERIDLGINFVQFFNYLLILLVNYDKKIIPNTFTIKKETNEMKEDVKYSSVLKRHNEFMNLLDKQYNEGKIANKLLRKFILKREEEMENNNPPLINKRFIFNK